MPSYDYRCDKCNNKIEVFEKVSDDKKAHPCPQCSNLMHRIISGKKYVNYKDLPKGHNLSATKRRELWHSKDPKDFKLIS